MTAEIRSLGARLLGFDDDGQRRALPSLIGLDVAREPARLRQRSLVPLIAALVTIALAFVALRVDLRRMGYAMGDALQQEQALLEKQRDLTVRVRELRGPALVSAEAAKRGFQRPEKIIDLAGPQAQRTSHAAAEVPTHP